MPSSRAITFLIAALWAWSAGPVIGQTPPRDVVDQTIADITPLSVSLRDLSPGLQESNDFIRLTTDGDNLVRQQGALRAVFGQSVYVYTGEGVIIPLIPPGTVFYVGDPFELPHAPPALPGRLDGRLDARIGAGPPAHEPARRSTVPPLPVTVPPPAPPFDRIVADPAYRAERVRVLMRFAAAQAAVGRSSSSSSSK